jgi:hypothetical protein
VRDTVGVRRIACAAAVLAALIVAGAAHAAAPRYIMVSGPGLPSPVLLADWRENHALLISFVEATKLAAIPSAERRPRLRLSLFWGWSHRSELPRRPADASQHGWYYPAYRSWRPVVDIRVNGEHAPRIAPRAALAILARHDVPRRLG